MMHREGLVDEYYNQLDSNFDHPLWTRAETSFIFFFHFFFSSKE